MVVAVAALAVAIAASVVVGWRVLSEIADFESLSRRNVGDPAVLDRDWVVAEGLDDEGVPGYPPSAA